MATLDSSLSFSPKLAYVALDYVPQCLSCWSEKYELIYCNRAYLNFFELPSIEELQQSHSTLYAQQQPDNKNSADTLQHYMSLAFQEGAMQGSFVFTLKNGENHLVRLEYTRLQQDEKSYLLCALTPIHTVKAPSKITKHEDTDSLAKEIMYASLLGSTLWNENLELIDCTTKRAEIFGVRKEEFINKFYSFCPLYQPDGKPSYETLRNYIQKALEEGYCDFSWTYLDKDNVSFFLKVTLVCIVLRGKKYVLSYTSDKNMHELPISSIINDYERMKLLLKHLPIGVDLWNKDFELFDCNEATLHLFGAKSKEEYIQNFRSYTPEFQPCGTRSAELIPQHLQSVFENGRTSFEWMHVDAQGNELPVKISIIRAKNGDEEIAVVYYKDLREIKENMRRAEQRLIDINTILDSAPYAINTWSKDFKPIDCNLATLRLYGFESKEDYFTGYHKVMPETQKDGRQMAQVFVQRFMEAFSTGYAFDAGELYNIKEGRLFPVEITLKKLLINGEEKIISYLNDVSVQKAMMEEIAENHRELTIARDAAEKSSRVKGEFLANMSHEIRTPMNGILGLLHLLALTKMQEQQKFYVDKIIYSAESLLRIINDILDFSKIEAGKLEMEHVSFSLADVQDELRTLFAPKFIEKNIRGEIFNENILDTKLIGDPLRLKQVLLNLIGNAIKFTENGRVTVSIDNMTYESPTKVCYYFSVEDSGIGLSEEQCGRLFEAFTQADTSTTRKYGGTGLGLVISKRIVEMMQGTIWVESTVGKGSRFHFSAVFDIDLSSVSSQSKEKDEKLAPVKFTKTGNILLVEDNEINQLIAVELIRSQGHTVDVAHNGKEAVDMVNTGDYDIVFMDIQMPIMDGLTATRKIRENERFARLPIIAMSAHAMTGDKEISLSHGMNDHLSKPINPELLYQTIDTWLRSPQMIKTNRANR